MVNHSCFQTPLGNGAQEALLPTQFLNDLRLKHEQYVFRLLYHHLRRFRVKPAKTSEDCEAVCFVYSGG